jgi:hypothetical protein
VDDFPGRFGNKPHDRLGGHALAAAGFPDNPEDFAAVEEE